MPFDEYQLRVYITEIRDAGVLDEEMKRVQDLMVGNLKHPESESEKQRDIVVRFNQMFRALLAEKSRQEALKKVGNDNRSNTQYGSTCVAHDPRPRISIWNILK